MLYRFRQLGRVVARVREVVQENLAFVAKLFGEATDGVTDTAASGDPL